MEEQQIPQTEFQKFLKTKPAMILGVILALGIGVLAMYLGVFNQCCGLGYLLVACIALYVPKIFGMTKTQYLIIFGVVFFLVLTFVGAFVFSKPMLQNDSDISAYNSDGFSNVSVTTNGEGAIISVTYSGEIPEKLNVNFYQVQLVTYQMITKTSHDVSTYELVKSGETTTYTATVDKVPSGFVYQISFEKVNGETVTTSPSIYYNDRITDSELTNFCLLYNAYSCGIIIMLFYLMLVLTAWSRKNLEKTRARMEAEGRLYPQGYGRCKECGSIVLPGETCCRKCGAYIDVPEELRHKKVDMVECSECGAEIPEDAKICPKCGATFDEEEEIVYVDSAEKKE